MLELALSDARAAAGAVVHGRVHGLGERAQPVVELLRLERSPVGLASYRVASAIVAGDGTFELAIPDDAPPDVEGRDCSLQYAIRAAAGSEEQLESFSVSP